MTETLPKPQPALTDINRPFWEGAGRGKLMLQKCATCGHVRFPLGPVCTVCLGEETEWAEMSGKGEILCHLVFHQVYHKAWAGNVPYSVVLVQLDEGPRLFSNVAELDGADTEMDMVGRRVEAVFESLENALGRHCFRLAG